jgi:D-arabinose 1-dehydrogenase-like Zn-dependent alcohol dehydrogenase
MTAPHESLAAVPESLDAVDAAPLLCAGITTYNALRNTDARPGDLVAVQGIGGLGHLAVQYAHASGYETVAVSRGDEKRDLAGELGADAYVDSQKEDPAEALSEMGGADVVLSTAPSADAMESVVGGLGMDGELVAVGVPGEDVSVPVMEMIGARQSVSGWPSGHAYDSEETLEFSALRDITPMTETYPLEDASEGYGRMISNEARFRVVLEP